MPNRKKAIKSTPWHRPLHQAANRNPLRRHLAWSALFQPEVAGRYG
jgi:hypothetical protein